MQAQQEHNISVAPDEGDHVQQMIKGKGVLSRVKHKARKLKDKVKKVTHSSASAHDDDDDAAVEEHNADQAEYHMYRRPPRTAVTHEDDTASDDSADDYDHNLKYEQLRSIGVLDKQGDGSEEEVHGGVPRSSAVMGVYFKSMDENAPVSIYKSAGPADTLQATPTEYRNYATINNDQSLVGCPDIDVRRSIGKSLSDRQVDVDKPDPDDHYPHDQIGIYREDLSTDRKLGIGYTPNTQQGNVGDMKSAMVSGRPLGCQSPTPSPVDGAHEQIYRPVYEPDNFRTSALPSESINAELYGDVLAVEDKLHANSKVARSAGDEYQSDQSDKAESNPLVNSNEENLLKGRAQTLEPQTENKAFGVEQENSSTDDGNREDENVSGTAEGWGKWSSDKLNSAVDSLALKLGGGNTIAEDSDAPKASQQGESDSPNNAKGNPLKEARHTSSVTNTDEKEGLGDSAVAGSVVVIEKLQQLKDTVASTF